MAKIVVDVDAEIYDALEILAKIYEVRIEDLVTDKLEALIHERRGEIEDAAEDENFNQFLADI